MTSNKIIGQNCCAPFLLSLKCEICHTYQTIYIYIPKSDNKIQVRVVLINLLVIIIIRVLSFLMSIIIMVLTLILNDRSE